MDWSDQLHWLALGLLGNLAFLGRFLVQWVASERAGRSYIPRSFWYLSLIGSVLLQRGTVLLATSRLVEAAESLEQVAAWLRGTRDGRGFVITDKRGATQLSDSAGVEVQRRELIELQRQELVLLELARGAQAP